MISLLNSWHCEVAITLDSVAVTRYAVCMSEDQLFRLFSKLFDKAANKFPDLKVNLIWGEDKLFPEERNFAICSSKDKDGISHIMISKKILDENIGTVCGLLMHELAHAILFNINEKNHTELATDNLAKSVFGVKIYYDEREVQTTDPNNAMYKERPSWLPK